MTLAQRIYDGLVSETALGRKGLRRKALSVTRAALRDRPVTYQLNGFNLYLPISHDLPIYRARHLGYSNNLGQVAAALSEQQRDLTIIDIGANIGDSVAILRSRTTCPILCIEGDDHFLPYLHANLATVPDVEIENVYAQSAAADLSTYKAVRRRGTAQLMPRRDGQSTSVPVASLASIVARHPRFDAAKLLKIDTDGHDIGIMLAARELIGAATPTLFFEFDPKMTLEVSGIDAYEIFPLLSGMGYTRWLLYSNIGDLVDDSGGEPADVVAARVRQLLARRGYDYLDICAVPGAVRHFATAASLK